MHRLCTLAQYFEDQGADPVILLRRQVSRRGVLYTSGQRFENLFSIRAGFFKTFVTSADGRTQVTGFHMAGDVIGLDGIGSGLHTASAVALEDSEVCVFPFERVAEMALTMPALQNQLQCILSDEIVRDHQVMLMLGSMQAHERVAAFLVDLLARLRARGWSSSETVLRMTRRDIGNFLGLSLETVSRIFSDLVDRKILRVTLRHVLVMDPVRLAQVANGDHVAQLATFHREALPASRATASPAADL